LSSTELAAFAALVPDRDRIRSSDVPLTVDVGEDNRECWYADAARWLVEGSGAELMEMPGGQGGLETHGEEFIAFVRRIAEHAFAAIATPAPTGVHSE
jgi:hypothetical protein